MLNSSAIIMSVFFCVLLAAIQFIVKPGVLKTTAIILIGYLLMAAALEVMRTLISIMAWLYWPVLIALHVGLAFVLARLIHAKN